MKRNDVVMKKKDGYFYGRVIRRVGKDRVLWLCCGLHFHLSKIDDLEVHDYKGREEYTLGADEIVTYWKRGPNHSYTNEVKFQRRALFKYMPTLRKLKQRATQFHGRNVWKTALDYEYLQVHE